MNDAQQACLTGTSQKLTSHLQLPAASRAHLCAKMCSFIKMRSFDLLVLIYTYIMGTPASLGIVILSAAAAERMPDQLRASVLHMSCTIQPIIPPPKLSGGLIYNFYENSSGHSICFVITTEGFPEKPNLEWSKGYRCNRATQSANEISPTADHPCLLLLRAASH